MLGVTFENKHSYNDWGVWLEDMHINPPLPKRYIVDVPARNGLLDLTPELTPTIRFENRTLTFNFRVKAGDWSTLVSQIYGQIHGQTLDVVSDLDPNWHWHGCVTVDDFSSDERTGKLVITVDADPFKLSNTENSYTVNGNGTITCVVDRMEISPAFELTAPTTVIYGDSSYAIESTATTEKTLSGDIVSFVDGTANPAVDLTADIDAVQDLHGYDHPWVGGAGKNKLPYPYLADSRTHNGITYTVNSDGTIVANGTATAVSTFTFVTNNTFLTPNTTYTLSGCDTNGNIYIQLNINNSLYANTGGRKTFTTPSEVSSLGLFIAIRTGETVSNAIFYPQIELGSTATTYEPYSNVCPISGWDEVNVNVSGINIWDEEWEHGSIAAASGENYNGGTSLQDRIRSKNYISVMPNTEYYFVKPTNASVNALYYYDNNQGFLQYVSFNSGGKFTTPSNAYYMRFISSQDAYHNDISINYPSTDTDYHAYNGQTYTIDLDGTRYGGTLDVTTGVLTITHGIKDLGDLTWVKQTTASWNCFSSSITDKKNGGTVICSNYPQGAIYGTLTDKIVGVNANSTNIYVRDSSYMGGDATAFKTAMSGVQLVYELATPQVVQLTAEQVMILKNQNNIWVDSGDVEVTYLAQDFAGKKFFIPDLELTEGSHELTIQGTGTTTVTYTNGRL